MDKNDKYLHSDLTGTIIKAYYNVYDKAFNPERRALGAQGAILGIVKIL